MTLQKGFLDWDLPIKEEKPKKTTKKASNLSIIDEIHTLEDVIEKYNGEEPFLYISDVSTKRGASRQATEYIAALASICNGDWEPDFTKHSEPKYQAYKYYSVGRWVVYSDDRSSLAASASLVFKDRDFLDKCIKKFPKLFDDYFMI